MPNKANQSKDQSNIVKPKEKPTMPSNQKEAKERSNQSKNNGGNKVDSTATGKK